MNKPLSYKLYLREYLGYTAEQTRRIPESDGIEDPVYNRYLEDFYTTQDSEESEEGEA